MARKKKAPPFVCTTCGRTGSGVPYSGGLCEWCAVHDARWMVCSPELLGAGVNCATTMRRSATPTYSHEHLVTKRQTEAAAAPPRETRPVDDVDVVARRIIMPRATWDKCVAIADQLRAAGEIEMSATDVATLALEAGLDAVKATAAGKVPPKFAKKRGK